MRCNLCWRELEGRAITTTCGHLLCPEDASKILGGDGACPICDQVLSESVMANVHINPSKKWLHMAMTALSPRMMIPVMESTYRGIMFCIGQNELEMQRKMNQVIAQYRQKCEAMQEKMEQVYTAYQKLSKRCQMMDQQMENMSKKCEIMEKQMENTSKDNHELQEKFSEKCRQKRKLDEMYDEARMEIESLKRSRMQPTNDFFQSPEPDLFSNPPSILDNKYSMRKGPLDDMWPPRRFNSNTRFQNSGGSTANLSAVPVDSGNRMPNANPSYGVDRGAGAVPVDSGNRMPNANPSYGVDRGARAGPSSSWSWTWHSFSNSGLS